MMSSRAPDLRKATTPYLYLIVGALIASHAVGIMLGFFIGSQGAFLALAPLTIAAIHFWVTRPKRGIQLDWDREVMIMGLLFLLVGQLIAGIGSGIFMEAIARSTVLVVVFGGLSVASKRSRIALLYGYGLAGTFCLLYILIVDRAIILLGRDATESSHNLIGLTVASFAWSAMYAFRGKYVRLMAMVTVLASVFISFAVDSRSGMLLSSSSMILAGIKGRWLYLARSGIKICASVVVILAIVYVFREQLSNVFNLNDNYRGLESGGSGRLTIAVHTASRLHEFAFVGVGPGNAERHLGLPLDNAFLSAWVETGFIGFLGYTMLLFGALMPALRAKALDRRTVFIAVYIAYGMLESRYITFGNPMSPVFFLILCDSAKPKADSLQRRPRRMLITRRSGLIKA
jgi:hypothetical protein